MIMKTSFCKLGRSASRLSILLMWGNLVNQLSQVISGFEDFEVHLDDYWKVWSMDLLLYG